MWPLHASVCLLVMQMAEFHHAGFQLQAVSILGRTRSDAGSLLLQGSCRHALFFGEKLCSCLHILLLGADRVQD